MNKNVKTLLVIFTLICIVVVIVFAAELILLNRKTDDGAEVKTSTAGDRDAENENATETPPTDSPPPTETNHLEESPPAEDSTSAPEQDSGDRLFTLAMTDSVSLELYANEELFEYHMMDLGYMFTYKGGGSASLEILLDYLPHGAAQRAVGFLDNYTGGAESLIEEERGVGDSPISGVYVTAMSSDTTYAAWICDIPGENDALGILLIIHYRDENQKDALYKLLDTTEIVPATIDEDVDDLLED